LGHQILVLPAVSFFKIRLSFQLMMVHRIACARSATAYYDWFNGTVNAHSLSSDPHHIAVCMQRYRSIIKVVFFTCMPPRVARLVGRHPLHSLVAESYQQVSLGNSLLCKKVKLF
jgi:hypothetical protein